MDLKSYLPGVGGFGSAIVASLCCVAPVVLVVAGIGSTGAAMLLMKIQWPAVLLSMALLGFSYFAYSKKRRQCATDGCGMKGRVVNLVLLGVSTTVISVLFLGLLFPYITWEILQLLAG